MLARRLISFRCVTDPHHPLLSHSPLYFSPGARVLLSRAYTKSFISQSHISYALSMQAKTNEKSNTFIVKLPLPRQITRGPLSMDAQVLGSIVVYIYLSDLAFCVPETFYAKFPVLVKSVFKIVTRALPLRPTPNHPATSKLRDRRRICLFFRAKGELRVSACEERVTN